MSSRESSVRWSHDAAAMRKSRSFAFKSPLGIDDFSAALAKMEIRAEWRGGDSEYYGSHVDGTIADGNEVRFFEGKWVGRPEGFVAELFGGADVESQENLMNKIIIALDAKDWRETTDDA